MPASSVPCRSTCDGSCGFGCAVASPLPSTMSMPGSDLAAQKRMRRSTPVSSSAIVTPRPLYPGSSARAGARSRGERPGEQRLRDRGGKRRAHGIDADDLRHLVEQRDGAAVERRGEAVEHPRVGEVRPHGDALRRERRQDLLLGGERLRRPARAPAPPSQTAPSRAARRAKACSTTIIRWPLGTAARGSPTRPRQLTAVRRRLRATAPRDDRRDERPRRRAERGAGRLYAVARASSER